MKDFLGLTFLSCRGNPKKPKEPKNKPIPKNFDDQKKDKASF